MRLRTNGMRARSGQLNPFLPSRVEIQEVGKFRSEPGRKQRRGRILSEEAFEAPADSRPNRAALSQVAGHFLKKPANVSLTHEMFRIGHHFEMHQVVGALAT